MSYAEHGSRIFLTTRFDSNCFLRYGDCIVPRKRSEARLKIFGSCTDLRAWSPNPLDNSRYFRDVVENPLPQGKIVPYDVIIKTLISLGAQTQTELASLRQQLKNYKSLRLSNEQKKELQNADNYSVTIEDEDEDSGLLRESNSGEDDQTAVPERPGTPEHSICCSSFNYGSEAAHRSRIDDESGSEYLFEENQQPEASSKTDSSDYGDPSEGNRSRMDYESHHSIIIEKDSEIIALKNKLAAKDVELEELKDFNQNLDIMLKNKEAMLDNLRRNLKNSQHKMSALGDQLNQGMEQFNKQLYDSQCLVDHLKLSLAEKSQECENCSREIEKMQRRVEETDRIRKERDFLVETLDEMNEERNTLTELNQEQAMHLADQEDEINRLLGLLKLKTAEYGEREMKMKTIIDELQNEIRTSKNDICRLEADRRLSSWKQFPDSANLCKMSNLEIRKFKCSLTEDLREVDEEIANRRAETRRNRCSKPCETSSKTTWKCDKDITECTNEQLKTVKVSAEAATSEKREDDGMYEAIVSHTSGSIEKIHRLIVELEPYQQERLTLIEKINYLNESLVKAQNRSEESRGLQDWSQCDEPAKSFPTSETMDNTIDFKKGPTDKTDRNETVRFEKEQLDDKIDEALVIHVKRSIERIERISLSLEGAGDYISREMAKKEKEIEARNEEIANLRMQVSSRASRGQGDHAGQEEHVNEMIRVKNELSTTQRSLQRTRDQLQSSDFRLKGANQRIKNLGVEIDRLTKENIGLNKTVLITNDFAIKVDEMQLRLDSLQEENSILTQRILRTNEICGNYEKKLIDFKEEGMRAKDAFERTESKFQSLLLGRDNKIVALQDDKNKLNREIQEAKDKVKTLSKQIESLRMENKNVDFLEALIKEILKLDKNAKRLRVNAETMKIQLENQRRQNDDLEENLNSMLRDNENLRTETRQFCDYIERNSRNVAMPEETVEQVLDSAPNNVSDHIEALTKRLTSLETIELSQQTEINELERKSRDDAAVIDNLRRDIDSWNKKAEGQKKVIVSLEEANADLKRQMEEMLRDKENIEQQRLSQIPSEEIIAKAERLEAEINEKDERIVELIRENEATKDECKILTAKLELLTNAKTELSEEMKIEKISWERKMLELQQQYKHRVRALHDQHNVSVKRLEAQYEEDIKNNGNPFDPENWLRSLTTKELTELHKRICKLMPCDASKIARALNDKQNQQLQEDEKLLHSDIVSLKTDHEKGAAIGYPGYIYERRKFDKPVETPVKDNTTFDMQQFNFINQCAMERYDSSN